MVWKKVAVLLDFVQITSTPPPQNLDNLYHSFLTLTCQKFLAGVTIPLPPHPQIDPLYTVCEKLTKNLGRALPSPPHLDKIQKNSYFFLELSLTQSVRYVGIDLLGQLKSKEDSWSKQVPREDLTTL